VVGGEDAWESLGSSRDSLASEQRCETSTTDEWVRRACVSFGAWVLMGGGWAAAFFVSVQLLWQRWAPKGNWLRNKSQIS
jgi:hypothetical protein